MTDYFLRGLRINSGPTGGDVTGQLLRLIYEFWGYCTHGGTSLTTPGGMPTTPTNGPTNGFEGTTVLATGSDGATTSGDNTFDSAGASFDSSVLNKHIVVWDPGSGSTEDSIYEITRVVSSTQLQLHILSGGEPHPTTKNLQLTTRTGLRYRIVDFAGVSALTWTTGHYVVIEFDGAYVNTGQADSQVQFVIENTQTEIVGYLSPAGTWTGSAFTDASGQIDSETSTSGWFSSMGVGEDNWFTIIADEASILLICSGYSIASSLGTSSGMHFEIPERLYPQAEDPNPITGMMWGVINVDTITANRCYGEGFEMVCQDLSTWKYSGLSRAFAGNYNEDTAKYGGQVLGGQFTDLRTAQNPYNNETWLGAALLCMPDSPTQFQMARCRLRRVRFIPNISGFQGRILGSSGEWLGIQGGIAWPWDDARMGGLGPLFPGGV